jgi:hypothetical protein
MTMTVLSQNPLYAQQIRHDAACAERQMRLDPTTFGTEWNRAQIDDAYAEAHRAAGAFAVFADYHPAANDEAMEFA